MKVEKEVVQKLKTEITHSPAASAVCYLLALRRRSRSTITLGALSQRMKQEGFSFSRSQYRDVLEMLTKAGVGAPITSATGKCVGIKHIRVSLAALGKAVCDNKEPEIVSLNRRITDRALQVRSAANSISVKPITSLDLSVNGMPAVLQFPNGLSIKELSLLLEKLQDRNI